MFIMGFQLERPSSDSTFSVLTSYSRSIKKYYTSTTGSWEIFVSPIWTWLADTRLREGPGLDTGLNRSPGFVYDLPKSGRCLVLFEFTRKVGVTTLSLVPLKTDFLVLLSPSIVSLRFILRDENKSLSLFYFTLWVFVHLKHNEGPLENFVLIKMKLTVRKFSLVLLICPVNPSLSGATLFSFIVWPSEKRGSNVETVQREVLPPLVFPVVSRVVLPSEPSDLCRGNSLFADEKHEDETRTGTEKLVHVVV